MNLQRAVERLRESGYKVTKRRKDMMRFLEEADAYRTAKDVLYYMEGCHKGISVDTIYRNLHLFSELGILETTDLHSEKHFRMKCTAEHHHHFICKDCGKTKKIYTCPMEEVKHILKNYYIESHKFEIYGLCPGCQNL